MGIGKQTVVGRIELGSFVFIFNDESEQNKKSSILRPGVTSRRTSPETISLSHYLCILWGRCQQITALGPKSSPLTVSVNKVLLEHGDVHLCTAGALEQNISQSQKGLQLKVNLKVCQSLFYKDYSEEKYPLPNN